jgi:hypothetical protein
MVEILNDDILDLVAQGSRLKDQQLDQKSRFAMNKPQKNDLNVYWRQKTYLQAMKLPVYTITTGRSCRQIVR